MGRSISRRGLVTAAIACTIHLSVVGLLARLEPRKPWLPAPVETEIDLTSEQAMVSPAPTPPIEPAGVDQARPARLAEHGAAASTHAAKAEPEAGTEVVATEAPAHETWTFSGLRAPSTVPSSLPSPTVAETAAPGASPQSPSAVGGVARALHEADVKRGFGRAGAVLSAAERAVQAQTSLIEGKARFEARVDSRGQLHVSLLDASRERALWEALTPAIAKRIDTSRLRLSPGTTWRGVVEVEVRQQYQDGTQPKDLGTKATVSAGRLRPNPSIEDLPGITIMRRGKVCSVGINLGPAGLGLGGGCSPENLNAVAQRVVRGQVVEEEML